MKNYGAYCVLSCDTIDLENCVSLKSSSVDDDLLIGTIVTSEEDSFQHFDCHKEGKKFDKGKVEKCYTKVDIHTYCKAMIKFHLNNECGWTEHLMHSQGTVTKNHAGYLQELKDNEVSIIVGLRVLKKQVGGSPFVGFTSRDAYISLELVKSNNLDGATGLWKTFVATKSNIALSWGSSRLGDAEKVNNKGNTSSSVWRMEMLRKSLDLISTSELNVIARDRIVVEVGPYHVDDLGNKGSSIIKDPIRSRVKIELHVRKKSIVEIMCNQVKGKRKNALMYASSNKTAVQLSMHNEALGKFVSAPNSKRHFSLVCFDNLTCLIISVSRFTVMSSLVRFHVLHTKDTTIYVDLLSCHSILLTCTLYFITSICLLNILTFFYLYILAINTVDIASAKLTVESICKVCEAHFIVQRFIISSRQRQR
ncbi:hypothetical protein M9H77_34843 [Catharanthus roseus]|uniref:Uncharacterized protein n=1 Tax=Catharanthus roseus TaxID=4058 RepID=A0ACB9ZN11_CATRO|nr:hypothetical protein M9H77_34843 [Catharanthus roseus]